MLLATIHLLVDKNVVDEWAIYRVTETGQHYMTFSFNNRDQAITKGRRIAEILEVDIKVKSEDSDDKQLRILRPKKKRAQGVVQLCRNLLNQGEQESEILQALYIRYIDADRSDKEAMEAARGILYDVKKQNLSK